MLESEVKYIYFQWHLLTWPVWIFIWWITKEDSNKIEKKKKKGRKKQQLK